MSTEVVAGLMVAGPIRHNWPTGPFYNLTNSPKCNRILISLGRRVTRERCSEGWAVEKLRIVNQIKPKHRKWTPEITGTFIDMDL